MKIPLVVKARVLQNRLEAQQALNVRLSVSWGVKVQNNWILPWGWGCRHREKGRILG